MKALKLVLCLVGLLCFILAVFAVFKGNYLASIAFSLIALNVEIEEKETKESEAK